jgi:hypothetical protein
MGKQRLCEGLTKRHVRGSKTQSLEAALREWNLASVLENSQLHFMNESSGLGTRLDVEEEVEDPP